MNCINNEQQKLGLLTQLYEYVQSPITRKKTANVIAADLKILYLQFISDFCPAKDNIEKTIEVFSRIDHIYCARILHGLSSEEDHSLLIHAISNFGQHLSVEFQKQYQDNDGDYPAQNAAFIIKGPFDLAHMSFVKSFIYGCVKNKGGLVNPSLIFLDKKPPQQVIRISYDLSSLNTYSKMCSVRKIIQEKKIGTIIWPSVPQNISLFLGSRFASQQVYWSSRYRNSLFGTVDKYFFGARSERKKIYYNGYPWHYGRFYVAEWDSMNIKKSHHPVTSQSDKYWEAFIARKRAQGYQICGTISTARKMMDSNFHQTILKVLELNPNVYYFYTSRDSDCKLSKFLTSQGLSTRFKRIQWIDQMTPLLRSFDLILDSFPVGASHALCYALQAKVPFITMWTSQNIRSSLLETFDNLIDKNQDYSYFGFALSLQEYLNICQLYLGKSADFKRRQLLDVQLNLFKKCLDNPSGMYQDFSRAIIE